MREPTADERQNARILLDKMTLSADVREMLERINRGGAVQVELLILLRSLGDTYASERFGSA